jgi:hypothetical protein
VNRWVETGIRIGGATAAAGPAPLPGKLGDLRMLMALPVPDVRRPAASEHPLAAGVELGEKGIDVGRSRARRS